jgi:teichuronic acid biosynthesis protein TuaE
MDLKEVIKFEGLSDYKNILKISIVLIFLLMIIDSKNIINHIFALVNIVAISYIFKDNKEKYFYLVTFLFAIMSFTISIPLGKELNSEQIDIYYIFLFIYIAKMFYDYFISFIRNKKIANRVTLEKIIFILFIIWVIVSFFIADNKIIAFKKLILYCIMMSFVIMIVNENKTKRELNITLKFLSIISIGIVVMGTLEIATDLCIQPKTSYIMANLDFSRLEFLRRVPTVFFYNPNNYGFVISLILLGFVAKVYFSRSKKDIIINLIVIILAQINLIFTRSRTAWVTVIGAIVFILIFFMVTLEKKLILKCFLSLFLILGIFLGLSKIPQLGPYYGKMRELSIPSVESNKNTPASEVKDESADNIELGGTGSVNVRATLIVDVVEGVFKEKNYFGFGLGNTTEYYRKLNNTGGIVDAHNWWVEVLGDFGIVGFSLFLVFYVILFIKKAILFKKSKEDKKYYILGMVLIVSTAVLVFGPSSVYAFIPFWLVNSLAISITSIYDDKYLERI